VTEAGTITVNTTATPKEIDIKNSDGQVAQGVYEVVGGRLRLCIGPERPAGFEPAGPSWMFELEQVSDAEQTPRCGHKDPRYESIRKELENAERLMCPSLGATGGDYGRVTQGHVDPYHGKMVDSLVSLREHHVIYLDSDKELWWCSTDNARIDSEWMRKIEGELTRLKSYPLEQLPGHKEYVNEMAGTALEYFLGCENKPESLKKAAEESLAILQEAKEYAIARRREYSRTTYAITSVVAVIIVLVIGMVVMFFQGLAPGLWIIAQYAVAGTVGAFFSIMVSISGVGKNQLVLNASADKATHVVSAAVKIGMGIVGAILVGLGVQAGVLLSFATSAQSGTILSPFTVAPLTLAFCAVAGISERLVHGFVEKVSTMGSKRDGKS
jgi:hypothetical protein